MGIEFLWSESRAFMMKYGCLPQALVLARVLKWHFVKSGQMLPLDRELFPSRPFPGR